MAKHPTPIPTLATVRQLQARLVESDRLLKRAVAAGERLLAEREARDAHDALRWDENEIWAVIAALEQVLSLFTDLIHVEDLVTLRAVDRRHVQLVLAQARHVLDEADTLYLLS